MTRWNGARRRPRTVLEQLIRKRQQTLEEFSEYAETFARDHAERGTLSVRHLQRLVAGRQPDGRRLGPLRPATARLLERIFGVDIGELLASPCWESDAPTTAGHLPDDAYALRVAVAVVVNSSEVLIVCRRGHEGAGISWQFPAGIVKPGASPEKVAVQETLAETSVRSRVQRGLGGRLHPITRVFCDYLLCDYLAGDAENVDAVENIDVSWVDKAALTRFISANQIFPPVLDALNISL